MLGGELWCGRINVLGTKLPWGEDLTWITSELCSQRPSECNLLKVMRKDLTFCESQEEH